MIYQHALLINAVTINSGRQAGIMTDFNYTKMVYMGRKEAKKT